MKFFEIHLPFTGELSFAVRASNADEALEKARFMRDNIKELEVVPEMCNNHTFDGGITKEIVAFLFPYKTEVTDITQEIEDECIWEV